MWHPAVEDVKKAFDVINLSISTRQTKERSSDWAKPFTFVSKNLNKDYIERIINGIKTTAIIEINRTTDKLYEELLEIKLINKLGKLVISLLIDVGNGYLYQPVDASQ
jgi:hypothetical protein